MTRVNKVLLLVALVALLGWATGAQDEPIKIGVVDVDQALNSTEEGKAAREELSRKQREADAAVQPMAERFRELQEELKGKKYVLSDEALFEKQVEDLRLERRRDILANGGLTMFVAGTIQNAGDICWSVEETRDRLSRWARQRKAC